MFKNTKISERDERLRKLKELKKLNINPYPAKSKKSIDIADILAGFKKLAKSKKAVITAGRLRNIRSHGNLTFVVLQDASGAIQLAISKQEVGPESYKMLTKLIDMGDFIEVKGKCFVTKKGENSLMVSKCTLLTKALRPLPEKWHGLKDEEERLRKRYLDILSNPDVKDIFIKKAIFWNSVRSFMLNKGFLEVETPVLEITPGGADARPFITRHNALDMDVYLRISTGELWQKRLMVAGLEKTFEIGRQFRNEGMDAEHLQDYTQMEFYQAYADYEDGMKLVEELYKYVMRETFGTLKFKINKHSIDLGKKWERYDYQATVRKYTGIDILNTDLKTIEKKLKELKIEYDKQGFNLTRAVDNLWKYCRKKITGPGFLVGAPITVSPLAKQFEDKPKLTQRFQPIIAGSELGNGYSELNDPLDQDKRFVEQQKLRDKGDDEAQMYDKDFVEALEYGMPPTCGFGMSERVFAFFMDKPVRECQIFPLMKPKGKDGPKKSRDTKIAVAIINKGENLELWEELNTIAHLNAAFGARLGKSLFLQDTIITKDNEEIKLNIQHAIMIKEAKSNNDILNLIKAAKDNDLEIAEFTEEMIATTDDKKVIKQTKNKNIKNIDYLGLLIFGKKSIVDKITKNLELYK